MYESIYPSLEAGELVPIITLILRMRTLRKKGSFVCLATLPAGEQRWDLNPGIWAAGSRSG